MGLLFYHFDDDYDYNCDDDYDYNCDDDDDDDDYDYNNFFKLHSCIYCYFYKYKSHLLQGNLYSAGLQIQKEYSQYKIDT